MKISQQLSDADHRYIFRQNLRRHYPWLSHAVLTVAILVAAWVTARRYGFNSPQTGAVVLIAVVYAFFSMYCYPWVLEWMTLRRIRKSAQYGRRIDYTVDEHGIGCVLNGCAYEYLWSKLTGAVVTPGALFLEFRRTGLCLFRNSFSNPADFDAVVAQARSRVTVAEMREARR